MKRFAHGGTGLTPLSRQKSEINNLHQCVMRHNGDGISTKFLYGSMVESITSGGRRQSFCLSDCERPLAERSSFNLLGNIGSNINQSYKRDTKLARIIKKLHGDRCQICDNTVELSDGQTYSEEHHIRPLGAPHNGPDIASNIIVLCLNHLVICDYGAMRLTLSSLHSHPHHVISGEYVLYHNEVVLQSVLAE